MEVAANGDKMTVAIHARAVEFIEFDLHAYWTDKKYPSGAGIAKIDWRRNA